MAADTYNGVGSGTHGRMDGQGNLRKGSRASLLFHLGMASKNPKKMTRVVRGGIGTGIGSLLDGPTVH